MGGKATKQRVKRISRAGRPRKQNVERYPSGKIKPEETQREVVSVGVEARKRIHGIDAKHDEPLAGFTLGRMFLDGTISRHHLDAGNYYAEVMASYYRCVGIPAPSARAQSLFSVKGHDGEVTESIAARARRASNKMMELEGILLRCGPQVKTTCFNLIVLDYEVMRLMPEAQLLLLKRGLQALHEHRTLRDSANQSITEITKSEFVGAA